MENFVNNKNAKIFDKDEYMNSISTKTEKMIPVVKKPVKICDDNIIIPTMKNYNDISKYNYKFT